jgi:hypothetical protein
MTDGYIYCFSNISMPGIVKVGMTIRTPDIRLNEANSSDTWRPPTEYKLEFAKKVKNPKDKEHILHVLLAKYAERISPKREFFRASPEDVKTFFELIDGEFYFAEERNDKDIKYDNENVVTIHSLHPRTRSRAREEDEELYWKEE